MNYEEFKREVLKLNDTRTHKITGSIGVYTAYKWIRKHKWLNIGRPLKEGEFYSIIRRINDYLAHELSLGKEIRLPHRLGSLELRKRKTRLAIVDGKLVTTLPINWDKTLNLWYEDEEAFNNKMLIREEEEDVFSIKYNKTTALYNNKTFYQFRPNRELKRVLAKNIKKGIVDAYLIAKENLYD